ncbi:hypothetical protein SAMN04487906_3115 [Zhouia amylolytica]|uniref:Uncharacterized protein n=2 Tax=Zhouia amylolytica TaxID=376730 RepID=W2UM09_9FLAO|nr:hypothetical protein [Zhouia amylolytica]ETN94486.1 hypothetical protein P278_24290 [Zhouia amylolytica AD3]MCQ0110285.1 hypothetical protein [Zhouia amylolytica]SFT12838.1 hypothetical protein SAMN04487906_3115 [Zhouia amylolytica]
MNIDYLKERNSLVIHHDLTAQYKIVFIIFILNIINASINLYILKDNQWGVFEMLWVTIATSSVIMLIYYSFSFFQKSKINYVELNDIEALIEYSVLGRKKYSLLLVDGSKRHFSKLVKAHDMIKTKELFKTIGVKTILK